ncbi:MAG: nucleoside triphosphate pyrophosphohydrolase [Thermodesulfobacteriota bacterium]
MKKNSLTELASIMERLLGPDGCPWDREQTIESLVPYIIEEAYEVISAIDEGSSEMLKEELGDLLFQIIFICQITKERSEFDINDVISASVEKMVRRHPHVFGDTTAETSEDVLLNWSRIKRMEKNGREGSGYLSGIPEHLPALLKAHKVSEKVSRVGFDWKNIDNVFQKVDEEIAEFKAAFHKKDLKEMEEEIGDILFTLVNVSRFLDINPEDALRKTIGKFITRFHLLEAELKEMSKEFSTTSPEEMEELWDRVKPKKRYRK